jgi:hypothetical protein
MLTQSFGEPSALYERRDFLRTGGGLAVAGFTLSSAFTNRNTEAAALPNDLDAPAKSCILVYLLGGPPHMDMWDLKPEAPSEIRGPYQPIASNIPGMEICEHLPRLSRMADKYAIVRSVNQRNSNHTPMIYYTLTGFHTAQPNRDNDIRPPQRVDFPHMGAVMSKFLPSPKSLPGYIAMPELAIRSSLRGQYKRSRLALRGGSAGFLGSRFDPLKVNGEPGSKEAIPLLTLPKEVSAQRFEERRAILSLLDQGKLQVPSTQQLATVRQQAVFMTGAANRGSLQAFSLDSEPDKLRDRYGRHRFGQTMLSARRLTEAGVPMVAIHFNEMTVCDGWDLHSKNFDALQNELLPMVDQSLSALLEDLEQRGRLNETLVVVMGEFGRTPRINKNAGRDHWGECSSTLLAGGGIRGGQVYGSSDKHAAYPASNRVSPADIQATMYHCMNLKSDRQIFDFSNRQWPISTGHVIRELVDS